jgi:hypothetical protein
MSKPKEREEVEAKFLFVKLTNGDNLMCTCYEDVTDIRKLKHLLITDPIQIFSFKMPSNGTIIEKYIMQVWAPFSSTNEVIIPISNVIFVGDLKEPFIEKYIEYITDPDSQQMIEEGMEESDEESQQDGSIEELIDEATFEEPKRWLH